MDSMRYGAVVFGAFTLGVLATLPPAPAAATVRIVRDAGGQIGPYLETLVALRTSGERVIIDGPCLSACTMILGVIPRDRICMTRRAKLGFHAAWHPVGNGQQTTSQGGTQLLMDIYPQNVRSWITSKGGLTERMLFLHGRELASMYPTCQPSSTLFPVQRHNR
jgi:hypothetical protein